MTGSGKTGLAVVLCEEALRARVPVLMIDVKGDLPNLLLAFPNLAPGDFQPWIDADGATRDGTTAEKAAADVAQRWREGLASWGLGPKDVAELAATMAPRVITPGTTAGEALHVLSSLETRSRSWDDDEEMAREEISASISLLLRLVERDADPARSREHVVLSLFAERRQRANVPAGLAELLADLARPPVTKVGALDMDEFLPPKERQALAQELNALLASPTFASWRQGASLDVGAWLAPVDGRTPAVIVSVAHLDDGERMLVLGLVLEQVLSWVRSLPGTSDLRALVVFDEVFGFLPPHPANPPSKRPLLALLKQARAFGVGVVLATQNPMDLDYKALSNAGIWCVGRLSTDADRERVVEGLAGSDGGAGGLDAASLSSTLKSLPPRSFFVRDVHAKPPCALLETRWALSWMRGPMTRREISRLVKSRVSVPAPAPAPAPAPVPVPEEVLSTIPPSPDGWRTFHGFAPNIPTADWCYTPHVAVTVVAHVRDNKLGIALNRARTIAAPVGADGRPDMTQAADVDRNNLEAPPAPGARYRPLPDPIFLKKTRDAAERAMREHVYRSLEVWVDFQRDLGLARQDDEAPPAFLARCQAEAQRRAAAEQQAVLARHAPKLARLVERCEQARAAAAQAEAALAAAPGTMGAVLIGVVAGARAGQRLQSQQTKAAARLDKARREWTDADAALREATAVRDAELAALGTLAARAQEGIERRKLAPKKGDVELTEIGVAWAAK